MMRGGKVRFEEAPQIQVEESSNQLLMDALQIDDSSSISDTRIEASFMSEGNVNRYNFVGRTPHAKVIEAEESRKRLKELTRMMAMPPISQTPVRISVPISEISPQSDISMSPAVMNQSQHSSVASTPADNNLLSNAEEDGRISPIDSVRSKSVVMDTSTRGIAMDSSTPVIDRSQQSLPTPNSTGSSNFSSDSSFNIVESLENKEPSTATAGFTVSAPAAAPSQPSVMNTPSTIVGSAPASSAKRSTKDARTPFSDISNRSAPALNQRDGDDGFDMSVHKTVSFHRSHIESSAKPKKSKAPVTPYAKIECSESEDGESDVDCNAIVVSQMQCPSPSVPLMHQEPSIVEKQLFLHSTEKQKPGPGGNPGGNIASPSNDSVASLKSSASATSVGIAELPVQRKTKEESRNWHGGLDIAKETIPAEIIQTQYIIVPAPRPEMHDVATTYSPMVVTVPPSPVVHGASVPVPVVVSFSPVPSASVACSPIAMQPAPVVEIESAPKLAVHVPNAAPQRSIGLPPMPPSAPVVNNTFTSTVAPVYTQSRVELETSTMSAVSTATNATSVINHHSRMGRPIANDFEYGVSFGKGPTASCVQAKKMDMKQQGFKKAETIVSPVESKLLVEMEKPVVSACTADLHPAKAFYSPNNTRKVQEMLGDMKPHKGVMHDRAQVVTRAEHPANVSGVHNHNNHNNSVNMSHVSHVEPKMNTTMVTTATEMSTHMYNTTAATTTATTVVDEEKVMYVTHTTTASPSKASLVSTSTLSEYQQDLSSIRAMDVSIQVDSAMFSQVKKELSAIVTATATAATATDVSSKAASPSATARSMVDTPGSSVQTDPMSQSVLLKSATKSSSSGAFNESMMSHSSSYYYAASGENDETGDETERSFALADLLPPTATKTGLGKGLFPAESAFMKQPQPAHSIVPTSLSNPWIYRVGFDSRSCNVGSTATAAKASPLMMASASQNSLFVGTGSLGKPQRLTIAGPNVVDKKQQLIEQWNESYFQDEHDDGEDEDEHDNDGAKSSRDVMFKEELEQRFAASKGTASTVTVDRTAAFHRSHLLDFTMRSDVAVATYTRQSMASAAADDSFMTSGADTTFTLDQSYMTKTTLMSHEEVIPRFAIKSLKRSSDETFEVKEMNFETAPGEYTTVMMVFDNNRPHPVTLKAQTALVRIEPMLSSVAGRMVDPDAWDTMAEELMAQQNEKSGEFFTVSPGELTIPPYKEGSLFITFAPAEGVEGIYSGAMRIKQDRKAYTILLRGESAMRHSVHSTPAALTASARTMRSSPGAIPEHVVIGASTAVDVSLFPNHSQLSWSKAASPAAAATAAAAAAGTAVGGATFEFSSMLLPEDAPASVSAKKPTDEPGLTKNMSTILLSASSIAEESALFSSTQLAPVPSTAATATAASAAASAAVSPAAKSMGSVSPTSTMFQDRLRALHERIAALSCKVLWKHIPSPTPSAASADAAAGHSSPAASETTVLGLQVQPEMLRIEQGMDEYHTLRLINPEEHRTMMVKLLSSHRCVRVSTTMVSINPEAEARLLVKLDRLALVEHFGDAMAKAWATGATTASAAAALDNWCCGALTLQYDADLEVTVSVVLSAAIVHEVVLLHQQQLQLQQQAAAMRTVPSVMSTPATTAQRPAVSTSRTSVAPASAVKTTATGSARKQQQQQQQSSLYHRRGAHPATPLSMNVSDYHHQLQYVDDEDASASFDAAHSFVPSAVKSVKSQQKSHGTPSKAKSGAKSGVSSYQKPPLAVHHPSSLSVPKALVSDNVSVASTISSHQMSIQPQQQQQQQRVRQGSITSQLTSSSSATATSSSVKAATVVTTHQQQQQGHSMLSVPDLSLVSTTSSLMRGPATATAAQTPAVSSSSSSANAATAAATTTTTTASAAAPSERTHLLIGKRRGLFFENVTAMFGSVMVGCLVRTRVILANASNEEAVVYLGDVDSPFLITKNEVRLKPRSYVRVPVQFLPTKSGHYHTELMAQSADGQHTTSIKLSGHCYV